MSARKHPDNRELPITQSNAFTDSAWAGPSSLAVTKGIPVGFFSSA